MAPIEVRLYQLERDGVHTTSRDRRMDVGGESSQLGYLVLKNVSQLIYHSILSGLSIVRSDPSLIIPGCKAKLHFWILQLFYYPLAKF